MSLYTRIAAGEYDTKLPYPERPKRPRLNSNYNYNYLEARQYADELEAYENVLVPACQLALDAYNADQSNLNAKFKADAIDDVFGDDAQRFPLLIEKLWSLAYENGHAYGNTEIYGKLLDFGAVVEAVKKDLAK